MKFPFHQFPGRRGVATAMALSVMAMLGVSNAQATESFVASSANPVLFTGPAGSWDGGAAIGPHVMIHDGTWYLFYFGEEVAYTTPTAIGFATSEDGVNWTKAECNPVMTGDGLGFDSFQVHAPFVYVDDETWVMYYAGSQGPTALPSGGAVGRATASDPCGPWARSAQPVLPRGAPGDWDSDFVEIDCIVDSDEGLVMYYSASSDFLTAPLRIGRATSADGINWTKYDDPTTVAPPFADSDPVLQVGPPGAWDANFVWLPEVRATATGWEMYYTGGGPTGLGYATSIDGIIWVKSVNNPMHTWVDDPIAPGPFTIEFPSTVDTDTARWLYYDYGLGPGAAIGLAISDFDEDDVADTIDNCTLIANDLQTDANGDSIGNACDPDVAGPGGQGDDDCLVNFLDLSAYKAGFLGNDTVLDLTGPSGVPDGVVNFADLGRVKAFFLGPPGPSADGCN